MSQEIQGVVNHAVTQASTQAKAAEVQTKETQRTRTENSADVVTLTDTANRLKAHEDALTSTPVVDTQRVADIRGAIAEGRFAVNPGRVADKLFQMETMLEAKHNGNGSHG